MALLGGSLIDRALTRGQRTNHLFKGELYLLLIADYLLLLVGFRQVKVSLAAPGVENWQFNFRDGVPHRTTGVKQAGKLAVAARE